MLKLSSRRARIVGRRITGLVLVGAAVAAIAPAAGSAAALDSDRDGLSNAAEATYGTNPYKADTDGDYLWDSVELFQTKTNPVKADTDGDGIKDGDEVNRYKTDPKKADTDGDGFIDGLEVFDPAGPVGPSNPLDPTSVPSWHPAAQKR